MAIIETKYSMGDVVWHPGMTTERHQHPCPDCLGSRSWKAESPAGGVFSVACPRCLTTYRGNSDLNLSYSRWTSTVRKLTIGQVRACHGREGGHEYMCHETGIGSGSVYRENTLFLTEEEARRAGDAEAAVNNADVSGWVAKQFDATALFCDYQLKDAAMEAAASAASASMYRVGYLLEDLTEAATLTEVMERIERWREESPTNAEIIAAVRAIAKDVTPEVEAAQ